MASQPNVPPFEAFVKANQVKNEVDEFFRKLCQVLQQGLDEVLRQENITPMYDRFLPEDTLLETWVDEDNRTLWLRLEFGHEEDTWFALNTDNFTGTGYPVAWYNAYEPWTVYRPGSRNAALEERECGLDVL